MEHLKILNRWTDIYVMELVLVKVKFTQQELQVTAIFIIITWLIILSNLLIIWQIRRKGKYTEKIKKMPVFQNVSWQLQMAFLSKQQSKPTCIQFIIIHSIIGNKEKQHLHTIKDCSVVLLYYHLKNYSNKDRVYLIIRTVADYSQAHHFMFCRFASTPLTVRLIHWLRLSSLIKAILKITAL